ncbi:DMT family transporter [Bradyrhizobium manausense]|nr:DMT family transporter [Bradyrhizobium manausense]
MRSPGLCSFSAGLLSRDVVPLRVRRAWTGGIFGAMFIATSIAMVPRLGVTSVATLIIVGQLLSSLAFDQVGFFGLPRQPITVLRGIGVVCLITGVTLVRG